MTTYQPVPDGTVIDTYELTRELDKVKSKVFLGRNAAFLGSLMSSLDFQWTDRIETAGTDGESFWWNPRDFLALPAVERGSTVEHELWHVARLHMLRRGDRKPDEWNYACDIRINRDLRKEGHVLPPPMWVQNHPDCPHEVEEDIYDWLIQNSIQVPSGGGLSNHMIPGNQNKQAMVNQVVKAIQQAKLAGCGNIPGGIEQMVQEFLAPVIPWRTVLYQWFTDLLEERYTWRRPNRRYPNIYLPSRFQDEGRLAHMIYYQDVSGSISDADIIRFNSELKYVWDTFQPKKMTVVQFDTMIQKVDEFKEGDTFDKIKITGRGGTCLVCVREHLIEQRPSAAVIFSDMQVPPMQKLPFEIPLIWIAVNASRATVPFGKLIHLKG